MDEIKLALLTKAALAARVARLEDELDRLRSTGTGDCYCDRLGETPCAYCQVEALSAALREAAKLYHEAKHFILGEADRKRFPSYLECPYWPCVDFRAALSDKGKGMEVREQHIELLRRAERIIGLELEPAPACLQPHGKLGGAALEVVDWLASTRAALDALGGT